MRTSPPPPPSWAVALRGEIVGNAVSCPGPGHPPDDRSLAVFSTPWLVPPIRIKTHSPRNAWKECLDYACGVLGFSTEFKAQPWDSEKLGKPHEKAKFEAELAKIEANDLRKIENAMRIWGGDKVIPVKGTIAEDYLNARGLVVTGQLSRVIRFHPACPWGSGAVATRKPCMLSLMRNVFTAEPCGIQRTALVVEGGNVIRGPRWNLGISGDAAIMIDLIDYNDQNEALALGEGLESSLSVHQNRDLIDDFPAGTAIWAAASSGSIAAFPVLENVSSITILAENDQGASAGAIKQCHSTWRRDADFWVATPKHGKDFNDALKKLKGLA